MKLRKMSAVLVITAALLSIIGVAALCEKAQGSTPKGVGIASPGETVKQFCDILESGERTQLEDMIYGYSDLNLTAVPDSDSAAELFECLWDSYKCTPVGELWVSGMSAKQDVSVEYFAVCRAEERARELVQADYLQCMESAQDSADLFDENNDLLESVVDEINGRTVAEIVSAADEFTATDTITLELTYVSGRWQITLNDGMVNILLGGINNG